MISLNTDRFEIVLSEVEKLILDRGDFSFEFKGVSLSLLKDKALWIKSLQILLIADLHFGKAAHFRKSGIPIPEPVHDSDLRRLVELHESLRPAYTYFLGDLFHSDWNEQWKFLNHFLSQFKSTEFHLVMGNHDVLPPLAYQQSLMRIHEKPLMIKNLLLSHEPVKKVEDGILNICGHIHPGVRLVGKANQSVRLPCFFYSQSQLLLPAFGNFTGLALVKPKQQDKVWAIVNEKIIPVLSGTPIG